MRWIEDAHAAQAQKAKNYKVAIDSEMTATGGRIIRFRCAQRSRRLPLLLFLLSAARRFLSPISCDEREMDHAAAARRPSSLLRRRRRLPHLLTKFFVLYHNFSQSVAAIDLGEEEAAKTSRRRFNCVRALLP